LRTDNPSARTQRVRDEACVRFERDVVPNRDADVIPLSPRREERDDI
jgi:hypothetical protein